MNSKVLLTTTLSLTFILSAHAQESDVPAAGTAKSVSITAKEMKDVIGGVGGRISVKDSGAKLLGGAAGDIDTENSNFENVAVVAGQISMRGGTAGDVNAAAGKIEMDIRVRDDLNLAGGEIILGPAMTVGGDTEVLGGAVDMNGAYAGDVEIEGDRVRFAGKIGGNLTIDSSRVSIAPGTTIGGNLKAPGLTELPEGVTVGGSSKFGKSSKADRDGRKITIELDNSVHDEAKAKIDEAVAKIDEAEEKIDKAAAKVDEHLAGAHKAARKITIDTDDRDAGLISPQPMGMRAWLTVLVTLAICGALALGVAPQFVVQSTERLAKEPLPSLMVGMVSLVAVPAALIAVCITIIGIPFALLGAAAYAIGVGLGLIALCLWGGLMVRTLSNQPGQETRVSKLVGWTLMGFLALAVLGAVPYVGRAIQILAIMTGAGAVLSTAWALRRKNSAPVAGS